MSNIKKIVISLLILIIIIPISACGYLYFKLNTIYNKDEANELLNETNYKEESGINNILLVGVDGLNVNEMSRSDAMMILTIDSKHKDIKLTSLARDTYVDIPGHGMEKLTHAHAYGGIKLLVETIEQNLKIDIQDYVVVNFYSFMDIVDALGGVTLDVKSSEIKELNNVMLEGCIVNKNPNKGTMKTINTPGYQKLNGYQTLAYGRMRYNDSAIERDRRQREIIEAIAISLRELPISKYTELLDSILPYIKTNMKPSEIIKLGTKVISIGNTNIKQFEFPPQEYSKGGIVGNDGWVLQYNSEKCIPILQDFIFNDVSFK